MKQFDDCYNRTRGTGLGLSICNRLIVAMGGRLIVESELGKGSTFRARISGIASKEESPGLVDEPKPVVLMNKIPKHVLIIDDSPVSRSVLNASPAPLGSAEQFNGMTSS